MGFGIKLRHVWLILSLFFMVCGAGLSDAHAATAPPDFVLKWGSYGSGDGQFAIPRGVAVDSSGNVFVADSLNDRIQKFDSSGTYLTQWGSFGQGNGQFYDPHGVAVDSSGNVFVADSFNHRIQKFDSSGAYLTQWGSYGWGDGQFYYPTGVAVDSSGNVFVADSLRDRIQKFDSSGTYLTQWGSDGPGDGQLFYPSGVVVDSSGNVFVADSYNHRIVKFDNMGTYLTQWGSEGSGDGQLFYPHGVAVDNSGHVFVADGSNHRIQKFDSSGTYLGQGGSYGTGDGQFNNPWGVAVDSSGYVFVADSENHRIQKFGPINAAPSFQSGWGTAGPGSGGFDQPAGTAVDSFGNVFVADTENHLIQKFDGNGNFLTQWGGYGSGGGQFNGPQDVSVDAPGNVFVADSGNDRIVKFDNSGVLLGAWGGSGPGEGQFNDPRGIACDSDGNLFVSDHHNHRIQKFDNSGAFLTQWGAHGSGDGDFQGPWGVAADGFGNIYVADTGNDRIQKFDGNGVFFAGWGGPGTGDAQFDRPKGVAVDDKGDVYITDRYNHRIQKFDQNGAFITFWGEKGNGDGEFTRPLGIAVDGGFNLFVSDSTNRIQKFTYEDYDGDGVVDIHDAFPYDPAESSDTDSDGTGDNADTDDDNDGVEDGIDPAPGDPDICGDTDGDTCDDCAIGTDDFGPLSDSDPGNDGPDSDGNGICDAGEPGTIIVEKQTDPDGAADTFTFTGDVAGTITDGEQIVVSGLTPGTYTSQETVPEGWDLTAITCDDANSSGDLGTQTAFFELEAGETVKCIFYNGLVPLSIQPEMTTVMVGEIVNFNAVSGMHPLSWRIKQDQSGAGLAGDPAGTAVYTAGIQPGTDVVEVEDKGGAKAEAVVKVTGPGGVVPQANWTLLHMDSDALDFEAEKAFDGDPFTMWHTPWGTDTTLHPHEIWIDLGDVYTIYGFRYLPRQDGIENGRVSAYACYVSMDRPYTDADWGAAVAQDTFANDGIEKEVNHGPVAGRYWRFVANGEVNGNPWTSAAEFNVLHLGEQPFAIIPSEADADTGEMVVFTLLGGMPPYTPSMVQDDSGASLFNNGDGTIEYTAGPLPGNDVVGVLDNEGAYVEAQVKVGGGTIPKDNWSVLNIEADTRTPGFEAEKSFDNDPSTLWHTPWNGDTTFPPHDVWIDLGDLYTLYGFRYLPRQDGSDNGWVGDYACYVSMYMPYTDADWGAPVAQGTFAADAAEKEKTFPPITGRYWRFEALTEVNGNTWTSAAEFNVLGSAP